MSKKPTSFQLLGRNIKIKYSPKLISLENCYGCCDFINDTITIQSKLRKDLEKHTQWHEIIHMILDSMGEKKLCNNEKFVDLLAGLIYQVVSTLK